MGKTARGVKRPGGTFFFQKYTVSLLLLISTYTIHHSKQNSQNFSPVSFKNFQRRIFVAVGRFKVRPQKSGKIDKWNCVHKWPFFRYLLSTQIFFLFCWRYQGSSLLYAQRKKMKKNHSFKKAKFERKQGKRAHIVSEWGLF